MLLSSRIGLVAVVLVVFAFSRVSNASSDPYLSIPTAVSMVHNRTLDLDGFTQPRIRSHYGYRLINGHHVDFYPWTVALFAVPVIVAVDIAHHLGVSPASDELVEQDRMVNLQRAVSGILCALAALIMSVVAYERVGGTERRRRWVAFGFGLGFVLATTVWSVASRALWQHAPSMLFNASALLFASRLERAATGEPRRRQWLAIALGVAAAGAWAVRPTNIVVLVIIGAWLVITRRRSFVPFIAGAAAIVVPVVAVNFLVLGSPLSASFQGGRISVHDSFVEALLANLISPGRGLLTFCPIAALAVAGLVIGAGRRALTALDWCVAAIVVAQWLVVSAGNEEWWAGQTFGPRFFTDVLPMIGFLALGTVTTPAADGWSWRLARVAAAAALVVSVAVNATGALLPGSMCWNVRPDIDAHPERVWDWSDPAMLAGFRALATSPGAAMRGDCVVFGGPS